MNYKVVLPCETLEPFVECFWLLSAPKTEGKGESQIVLPDGRTELIVHFGSHFLKLEGKRFVKQAVVLMSGQLTKRIVLKPSGEIGVVAARFKPAGAARFFNLPYEEIVDRVVDFSAYEKEVSKRLLEQVAEANSDESRLKFVQDLLTERLQEESKEDIYVRQACRYIMQSEGEYSVEDLVKLIGFSERQLERKFKNQVGISPKVLSRIVRFQKFLGLSKTTGCKTLTEAALVCGYYDQSHFIRDFTKFSGVSPVNYLTSNHPILLPFLAFITQYYGCMLDFMLERRPNVNSI